MKPVQDHNVSKEDVEEDARIPARRASRAERLIERTVFSTRWLIAPFYLGLVLGLVALLAKFVLQVVDLLGHVPSGGDNEITVGIDTAFVVSAVLLALMDRISGRGHQAQRAVPKRGGARRRLKMRRASCTVAQAGDGQTRIKREREGALLNVALADLDPVWVRFPARLGLARP